MSTLNDNDVFLVQQSGVTKTVKNIDRSTLDPEDRFLVQRSGVTHTIKAEDVGGGGVTGSIDTPVKVLTPYNGSGINDGTSYKPLSSVITVVNTDGDTTAETSTIQNVTDLPTGTATVSVWSSPGNILKSIDPTSARGGSEVGEGRITFDPVLQDVVKVEAYSRAYTPLRCGVTQQNEDDHEIIVPAGSAMWRTIYEGAAIDVKNYYQQNELGNSDDFYCLRVNGIIIGNSAQQVANNSGPISDYTNIKKLTFLDGLNFQIFQPSDVVQDPHILLAKTSESPWSMTVSGGDWEGADGTGVITGDTVVQKTATADLALTFSDNKELDKIIGTVTMVDAYGNPKTPLTNTIKTVSSAPSTLRGDWASALTATSGFSGSFPATGAFDGVQSTKAVTNSAGTATFAPTTPIPIASTLGLNVDVYAAEGWEWRLTLDGESVTIPIDGNNYEYVTTTKFAGKTISSATPLTIQTWVIATDKADNSNINGIQVDSVLLVDSAYPDPTPPNPLVSDNKELTFEDTFEENPDLYFFLPGDVVGATTGSSTSVSNYSSLASGNFYGGMGAVNAFDGNINTRCTANDGGAYVTLKLQNIYVKKLRYYQGPSEVNNTIYINTEAIAITGTNRSWITLFDDAEPRVVDRFQFNRLGASGSVDVMYIEATFADGTVALLYDSGNTFPSYKAVNVVSKDTTDNTMVVSGGDWLGSDGSGSAGGATSVTKDALVASASNVDYRYNTTLGISGITGTWFAGLSAQGASITGTAPKPSDIIYTTANGDPLTTLFSGKDASLTTRTWSFQVSDGATGPWTSLATKIDIPGQDGANPLTDKPTLEANKYYQVKVRYDSTNAEYVESQFNTFKTGDA